MQHVDRLYKIQQFSAAAMASTGPTRLYVSNVDFHVRKCDSCLDSFSKFSQRFWGVRMKIIFFFGGGIEAIQDVRHVLESMGAYNLEEVQQFRGPTWKWRNGEPPIHCTLFLRFTNYEALWHCWGLIGDQWIDGLSSSRSPKSSLVDLFFFCPFFQLM